MNNRIFIVLALLVGFAMLPSSTVNADGSRNVGLSPELALAADGIPRPLLPNTEQWYQFTYPGDHSPVEIHLLDGGARDISFALYTPDQMEQRERGERTQPIGQMRRASGEPEHELVWAGKFNCGGVFYVVIRNYSTLAYTIRLVVRGPGVQIPHTTQTTVPVPASGASAETGIHERFTPDNAPAAPLPANLIADTAWVELPGYVGVSSFSIPLTARPAHCTPASAMPASLTRSVLLCPDQLYAPFRVIGSNLTVYGDPTATIRSAPRGFGITVTGSNVVIVGVRVEANTHPADLGHWLCLYEACSYNTIYQSGTVRGGIAYGGGILLQNSSNSAVLNSVVWGGTIGVAAVRGSNNRVVGNTLSRLNGWGAYLLFTERSIVVNNTFDDVNRDCVGPDGFYYGSGCESAGLACIGCQNSVIVGNTCARAGNCYYATGEGGLASNHNKFYNNRCSAANNNCFEITFSEGNQFDYNVATSDPATGQACTYPFWIAGSIVQFGKHNDWACAHQQKRAEDESKSATPLPTEIRSL